MNTNILSKCQHITCSQAKNRLIVHIKLCTINGRRCFDLGEIFVTFVK